MEKKSKVATAAAALAAMSTARTLYGEVKDKWDERTTYTARVNEESYVYRPLMNWINEQVVSKRVKLISEYAGVTRFYDSSSATEVTINGHNMWVKIQKPDLTDSDSSFDSDDSILSDNLVFTARSAAAIDALQEFLEELTEVTKISKREIYIYNMSSYGWEGKDFKKRSLDTVFLPEGVKEEMVADVKHFMASEARYAAVGIPWHRGYLLYGQPGNGKSSIAAALACEFKFNLYNLPLSGIKDDRELADKISKIQTNSLLLLEDVDVFAEAVTRSKESKKAETGPTLAGLLNALDGVSTPHGLLTIMTTNRREFLDDALVRAGRMDFKLELSRPDVFQIASMYEHVYGEELNVKPKKFKNMADLTNVFKVNINDPEAARVAIKESE